MSMNINSVTNAGSQSVAGSGEQQNRQAMKDLVSAIKSGNLQDAQQAYATLTNGQTPPANSPLAKIGAALQTGNMTTVQNTVKSLRSGHHHHQQGGSSESSASSSTTTTVPNTLPGQGANVNVLA
ncbi:MAG: hypothetical protein JOY60_05560 [Burkholderiaceae bacterium]|nr:hypothetical protein [Roseateles sp.]MBV8469313.1 hypothetical protein [Burkholderiaceae bacterium]